MCNRCDLIGCPLWFRNDSVATAPPPHQVVYNAPLMSFYQCTFCACVTLKIPSCVSVVSWILPHTQPGTNRVWVLLQNQRAQEEMVGTVRHGTVSVYICVGYSMTTKGPHRLVFQVGLGITWSRPMSLLTAGTKKWWYLMAPIQD